MFKNLYENSVQIFPVNNSGKYLGKISSESSIYNSPIVYLLNNKKDLYIGETINILNRFVSHNNNQSKKNLSIRHIIHSDFFNKSVILHLEAFLISHFSAEGSFNLLNGNLGNNSHYYYQKEEYERVFPLVWEKLQELNIAKKNIQEINNSDVFKYSPYKSLTIDQQDAIIQILTDLSNNKKGIIINGSAGTGKTVLAIYLIKLLVTPIEYYENYEIDDSFSSEVISLLKFNLQKFNLEKDDIALVVSMSSLRKTLQDVFSKITGLDRKMVISPTDIVKRKYKLVLVDESHRLKQRKNIPNYGSFDESNRTLGFEIDKGTELDWILKQSNNQIFFYDRQQSIKPSDIEEEKFTSIASLPEYTNIFLKTQIRSKGGNLFTDFVNQLLDNTLMNDERFESEQFEFLLFDDISLLRDKIIERDNQVGLSRLVAGYSWEWISKKDKGLFDIVIDKTKLKWNSTYISFINSPNAVNEVGCIHTTQGYDLNYVGVIFGEEIGYNKQTNSIEVYKDNYKDKNGKNNTNDSTLNQYIINIYKTLLLRGIKGVYVYCCNKDLRDFFSQHINIYNDK
ncbi:DNA/RNA helicase domain-containing protein [Dysgonomonas sp. HGC4]|uniref:DNA/RNA helicase domain-containing protein n=1 Tax=Dysgonomonas sp. HGC4 TaxID=1658009 RepID=UPI0006800AE3|nr:DNA/RNA helicase domain-containing protein [Dysgonomonas sp. HGC4]MBD8348966.1 DUF2075 domain-containing protein [Dysgonomonas sp. HGC4]